MKLLKALAFGLSGLALAASAHAAAITPGNLVIFRAGDGAAALSGNSAAVFLDEYTTAGVLVQSIPVSASGGTALTATGNSTTEGIISLSQDGSKLVFAGYRANAGTATGFAANNKVIGTVGLSGVVDTSVAVTDVGNSATRSATTVDGSTYYVSSAGGVRYVGTPSGAATSALIDTRNSRQVNLYGNTLYASNGSTTITGKVQHYGTLPTGTTTATPVVVLATTDAVNGFIALDLDSGVAGVDTIYANSTVTSQLIKWTNNGTSWAASGSISSVSAQDLTATVSGTTVTLYLTSGTTLSTVTDSSGFGGTLAGTPTSLATAGANTAFRGIGILVPEPSSLALFGAAALMLTRRVRRRA